MPSQNKREHRTKDEWVGDAALNLLCHEVLLEKFPDLSCKDLTRRHGVYIRNEVLTWYARYRRLPNTGCNRLERMIAEKIRVNYGEARALVEDIITTFETIQAMSSQERRRIFGSGKMRQRQTFTLEENIWKLIHRDLAYEEKAATNPLAVHSDPEIPTYLTALRKLYKQRERIYEQNKK